MLPESPPFRCAVGTVTGSDPGTYTVRLQADNVQYVVPEASVKPLGSLLLRMAAAYGVSVSGGGRGGGGAGPGVGP